MHVIGVMSGTSLDGIDVTEITFSTTNNKWSFQLGVCKTYGYSQSWEDRLRSAPSLSSKELEILNKEYTQYLASVINQFISEYNLTEIDAVCSHGHTILHQPHNGFTLQIGNLPELATLLQKKVVCDFRVADVALGGQGAPLVPIGDQLLFPDYDYCINFGGFANISFEKNKKMIAYDICPVNVVLNTYALKLGKAYDAEGNLAKSGKVHESLLKTLNRLPFYEILPPKSLGIEWVNKVIFPLIESYDVEPHDVLRTFTVHVAQCVGRSLEQASNKRELKVLITGGGVYNTFLVNQIKKYTTATIVIPIPQLVEYKEALIFGLLGVLKLKDKVNVLASVTGAMRDHSSGNIFNP